MKNAIKLILTGDAFYAIGCLSVVPNYMIPKDTHKFEEIIRDILAFIGPNYLM